MTHKKRMILWLLLVGAALLIWAGSAAWDYQTRQSALATTREWARLNPFPTSAKNIKVDTRGGMFTREFYVEFDAPPADVEAWILASPGPATAKVSGGNVRDYVIKPGGGAQFAELFFYTLTGHVVVHVYWS